MSTPHLGQVTHYYDHLQVAVLSLADRLWVGDYIYIHGHTTDFHQKVTSLQINHQWVSEARPGQEVALKVSAPVRPHDVVDRSTAEETEKAQDEELLNEQAW